MTVYDSCYSAIKVIEIVEVDSMNLHFAFNLQVPLSIGRLESRKLGMASAQMLYVSWTTMSAAPLVQSLGIIHGGLLNRFNSTHHGHGLVPDPCHEQRLGRYVHRSRWCCA